MPKNVQVTISADANKFVTETTRAAGAATKLGSAITKGVGANEASISRLSNTAAGLGAALALGVGAAIKTAADFDAAMSNVAATGADARKNLRALREEALKLGAETSFSAGEAAAGIENLAKAGVSAADTLGGGLKGSLDLAAAGGLSVSDAAETAATAMSQFGLSGRDVPKVADLLAQAAGTAQGEVSDMAAALKQSGSVANQFGLSLDETTQALSIFAREGGVGSDAGTSFKTMLNQLYAPTGSAVKVLDQLGVSAYDTAGNLKPIGSVIDSLKGQLDSLPEAERNQALIKIFGTDGIRAANALLKDGSAGLRDAAAAFGQYGSAADVARIKQDNLKGDIEKLGGSLDTLLIKFGEGSQGGLRTFTQTLTSAIDVVGDMPAEAKQASIAVGGISAAGLLAVGGIGRLAVSANESRTAMADLRKESPKLAGALGAAGKAAGLAAAALIGLQVVGALSRQLDGTFIPSLEATKGALLDLSKVSTLGGLDGLFQFDAEIGKVDGLRQAFSRLNAGGVRGFADGFAETLDGLAGTTEATTTKVKLQFESLDQGLTSLAGSGKTAEAERAFRSIADEAGLVGFPVERLIELFPQYSSSVRGAAESSKFTITSTGQLADLMTGRLAPGLDTAAGATRKAGEAAIEHQQKVQDEAQAMQDAITQTYAYANSLLAISGGQIGMEAAIDAATAALDANGKTLDLNTEKGRANQTALNQLAQATQTNVTEMTRANRSAVEIAAQNERGRKSYIRLATDMGMPRKEAERLAKTLFALPANVKSQVVVAGAKVSEKEAKALNKEIQKLPPEKRAKIVTIAETKGAKAARQAMAEVKDKTVIARSKGDFKGSKDVAAAQKALKDRYVKAVARGDKKGALELKAAMDDLKSRTVQAKANAVGKGAVDGLVASVDALRPKTVTVTTISRSIKGGSQAGATGGLFTEAGFMMRGPLRRSTGGPVWGAGSATSDSIPALLSNGEFVINARSVSMLGSDRLAYMNRTGELPGFRAGGFVGALGFAAGGQVDVAALYRLITQLSDPLRNLGTATSNLAAASKALAAATKTAAPFKARYDRADAAYDRAVNARDANRLANANQIKAARDRVARARSTKGKGDDRAAQANLSRVSRTNAAEAARLNARVTATSKTRNAAQAQYNKYLDATKARTEALKNAQAALLDQQRALADAAKQLSDQSAGTYRSGSTDARDWIELMRQGSTDIAAFTAKIKTLRASGLSETLVQQIIGMGAVAGSEIANQIALGGKTLVGQLNQANSALQTAADNLGYVGATGVKRLAGGGFVSGPGTSTSDSVSARLSNGEYVVNAAATAMNRTLLDRVNYGRTVVERPRFAHAYAGGGYVNTGGGVDNAALTAAVQAGMSNVAFELAIDGKPIRAEVRAVLRDTGRQLARSG